MATLLPGLGRRPPAPLLRRGRHVRAAGRRVDDEALKGQRARRRGGALLGGVTTLRDVGDRGFVTLSPERPDLPTILAAGPPLTVAAVIAGTSAASAGRRRLVRAVATRRPGLRPRKVMVTGGFHTPTFPMWETQFIAVRCGLIVDHSHRPDCRSPPTVTELTGSRALSGRRRLDRACTFSAPGRSEPTDAMLERLATSEARGCQPTVGRLAGYPLPLAYRLADNITKSSSEGAPAAPCAAGCDDRRRD